MLHRGQNRVPKVMTGNSAIWRPCGVKNLERDRGFLIHLAMIFPDLTPYLKGFHLTLDSWRDGRNLEGWKI